MAGPAVPVHIQDTTVNLTASTTSMAPALTGVAAGNTLVLAVSSTTITAGYVASAVADSAAATWFRGPVEQSSAGTVEWWYGVNAAAATHTLTVTTTSGTNGCWLSEFSGVATVSPIIDVSAVNTGTATSVTVSLTPSNDYELLLFATVSANTQTASPSSPYTAVTGPTLAGAQRAGVAYVASNPLVAAYAPVWTQTSGVFAAAGLALKGATPPGDLIWNDTAAQANGALFETQARPDFLDSVIDVQSGEGTGVQSGCAVSPNTNSDFKFQVSAGTVLQNWGPVSVSAVTAQSVTTADGTNPRRDLVYVTSAGTVTYLAGVANATPCPPALPVNCVPLAIIEVPASATVLAEGTNAAQAYVTDKRALLAVPSVALSQSTSSTVAIESYPRMMVINAGTAIQTGTIRATGIWLPAGYTIGHIIFRSAGGGAASTPTHWWFCLLDINGNLLATTADQTTTAWAASTQKSLAIATTAQGAQSSFIVPSTGLYYIGVEMTATTGILAAVSGVAAGTGATPAGDSPPLFVTCGSSLTTPSTFPTTFTLASSVQSTWGAVAA